MSSAPNPFQAPAVEPQAPGPPAYRLYNATSVMIATLLGSMAAGGVIMALNAKRLGRGAEVAKVLGLTAVLTAAVLVLGEVLPERVPSGVLVFPQILAMRAWAEAAQGEAVKTHQAQGGTLASKWAAAGIGLLGLVLVFGAVLAVLAATGGLDE